MRTMDSPIGTSHFMQGQKQKQHESPITKLTNLTDVKSSCQPLMSKNENIMNDRNNQVFVPKNAAKYVQEPYERKQNREKQIDEIRKKYYENSAQKVSRQLSQIYGQQIRLSKRDENGREITNDSIKRSVLLTTRYDEPMVPNRVVDTLSNNNSYINQNRSAQNAALSYSPSIAYQQKLNEKVSQSNFELTFQPNQLNPASTLDRISEASNSNYETINKTLESFSPQRNRIKSSFLAQDRSGKRKLTNDNGYYFVQSFQNKENQSTAVVKETTSVYNESATRASHVNSYYDRDSAKSTKLDSRNGKHEPSYLKPFTLEDNSRKQTAKDTQMKPNSTSRQPYNQSTNSYPTIYDNFLPKNSTPSTQQKSIRRQDQILTRPRTYTEDKKHPVDQVHERRDASKMHDPQDQAKRRLLKFQDDDKIKDIQKRLKAREAEFKKRQEQLRTKCSNQSDRMHEYSQTKQHFRNPESSQRANQLLHAAKNSSQQQKPNVQKQIERLSRKIQQFQDRKKELNIPGRNVDSQLVVKSKPVSTQVQGPTRQFEDARKALEEFRQGNKVKSTSEVYQLTEYQIPSYVNNQESNCRVKYEEEIGFHQKYLKNIQSPTESQNRRCEFIENTKPMYSEVTLPTPKRMNSSSFGFQLFKIQSEGDDTSSSHTSKVTVNSTTSNKTNSKECKSQFEIHRRTDDGIEQRKKKLQENPKTGVSQEMKKLVSLLSQQTIHDEEFRNCKIWFQNERSENKWRQLKRQLKQSNIQFTQLKDGTISEFLICQDENNPFFSVNQQSKFSYQTLVKSYIVAKTFWEQNIYKKFNKNQLKAEGFTLEKFDLQKKGHINMEDLVRFLNFESGNFYRNRDLVLIFKRMASESNEQSCKTLDMEKIFRAVTY